MRPRVVFRSGGMNDGQSAVFVGGFQFLEQGIETKEAIERDGIAFVDGDARTSAVVAVVPQRGNDVQTVRAATKEDDHQRVALITIAVGVCMQRGHSAHWESG